MRNIYPMLTKCLYNLEYILDKIPIFTDINNFRNATVQQHNRSLHYKYFQRKFYVSSASFITLCFNGYIEKIILYILKIEIKTKLDKTCFEVLPNSINHLKCQIIITHNNVHNIFLISRILKMAN